jgi:hypothetical protein
MTCATPFPVINVRTWEMNLPAERGKRVLLSAFWGGLPNEIVAILITIVETPETPPLQKSNEYDAACG